MKRSLFAAALLMLPLQAHAITNEDFLDKMSDQEQTAFLQGAVEAISHLYTLQSNKERSACIYDWIRGEDSLESLALIYKSMEKRRDLSPTTIILGYIRKNCGGF